VDTTHFWRFSSSCDLSNGNGRPHHKNTLRKSLSVLSPTISCCLSDAKRCMIGFDRQDHVWRRRPGRQFQSVGSEFRQAWRTRCDPLTEWLTWCGQSLKNLRRLVRMMPGMWSRSRDAPKSKKLQRLGLASVSAICVSCPRRYVAHILQDTLIK